ncbi:MAG: hypothetical protein ACKVPJ_11185 [Chitinophagales bacterium]
MKKKDLKRTSLQKTFLTVCLIVAGLQISCSSSPSQENLLDGKSFSIQTMEKDKPETAVAETCSFSEGYFDNVDCHQYGFSKGKYTATKKGDGVMSFEATMDGGKEGKMVWSGEVNQGNIKGDLLWKKEGQADLMYTFSGAAK